MLQRLTTIALAALVAACTWQPFTTAEVPSPVVEPLQADALCADTLDDVYRGFAYGPRLASDEIRLINWNAQKHGGSNMHADLARLANNADLVLLQEAVVDEFYMERIDPDFHWVFAPGYQYKGVQTGVMTASRTQPLTYCRLSSTEPWLGSPKATSITVYPLAGRDDTLLVINVHLINFTVGKRAMSEQLNEALHYVAQHEGPVIISGDFNTWSQDRDAYVAKTLAAQGLSPVSFTEDDRTRFFGNAVDHVYVRGLTATTATTHVVESSDHNPLEVLLEVI